MYRFLFFFCADCNFIGIFTDNDNFLFFCVFYVETILLIFIILNCFHFCLLTIYNFFSFPSFCFVIWFLIIVYFFWCCIVLFSQIVIVIDPFMPTINNDLSTNSFSLTLEVSLQNRHHTTMLQDKNLPNLAEMLKYLKDIKPEIDEPDDYNQKFKIVLSDTPTAILQEYSSKYSVQQQMTSISAVKSELCNQKPVYSDASNDGESQSKQNLCKEKNSERIQQTFRTDKLGINRIDNNVYRDKMLLNDCADDGECGWWIDQIYYHNDNCKINFQYDPSPSFVYYGVAI